MSIRNKITTYNIQFLIKISYPPWDALDLMWIASFLRYIYHCFKTYNFLQLKYMKRTLFWYLLGSFYFYIAKGIKKIMENDKWVYQSFRYYREPKRQVSERTEKLGYIFRSINRIIEYLRLKSFSAFVCWTFWSFYRYRK